MSEDVSTKTRRIAKNTLMLYMRSLLSLFISLYSSRLVLQALGENDLGIYNVVGGFVSMFWLVSGSLTSAISRFLNYEMGTGDKEKLKKVFSMSLNIMVILSFVVVLLTETFGMWFLNHKMNITPGRETAAFWCFQFSVLTVISGFTVSPFNSAIVSHERMSYWAYLSIAEVVLKLFIALYLAYGNPPFDILITYAGLWLAVTLTIQIVTRAYAVKNFEECRFRWVFDRKLFKEMLGFASWNMVGSVASTFSGQGVNMVMNVVFGPAVNAAMSLSNTVNHTVTILVNNFTTAINPQVVQSYAAKDTEYMRSLLFRGTRFSFYIMFLIAFPLILETPFVVHVWLGDYPDHTVNFIRLSLLINTYNIVYCIFPMGINATGNIKRYQLWMSVIQLTHFPIVYVLMHNGLEPEWIYTSSLFLSLSKTIIVLDIVKKQLGYYFSDIFKNVYLRVLLVISSACIIPLIIYMNMEYGVLRFLVVVPVSIICSIIAIFFIGCYPSERKLLLSYIFGKIGIDLRIQKPSGNVIKSGDYDNSLDNIVDS